MVVLVLHPLTLDELQRLLQGVNCPYCGGVWRLEEEEEEEEEEEVKVEQDRLTRRVEILENTL